MNRLRPVPVACHTFPAKFLYKDLHNCTHVFIYQDATRWALVPPYSGPYQVPSMREKMLQLLVSNKSNTVSDYILNETDCGYTSFNPSASRHRNTGHTFANYLSNHLPEGGGHGNLPQNNVTPIASFLATSHLANQRGAQLLQSSLGRARLTGSV
jgi:hypothetical protein